jgi:hypothetical protein
MDINQTLEADWIQIRAILKGQVKRLRAADADAAHAEALERARRLIAECEKVIAAYSIKV